MSSPFSEAVSSRILVLDGAMGTMLQKKGLSVGEQVNVEHPDAVLEVHRAYIEAGADIIETNSFGANPISLAELGCAGRAEEFALSAARIARRAADEAPRKVWVAGSIGPGGKALSLSTDADKPDWRACSFDEICDAYRVQAKALIEGGVDLILLETWYDALNAKAAIAALDSLDCRLPLLISATVSDRSGRTLTGQTLEAFYHSVRHARNLAGFGINCSLGAAQMAPLAANIDSFSSLPLIFYPNAGMPDGSGTYSEGPETMAFTASLLARKGLLNITGGCCGTTPDHIRAIAAAVRGLKPRTLPEEDRLLHLSGLEAVVIDKSVNFTNIGERTNVAGSRKFAKLIAAGDYEAALSTAASQIEGGARVIDVNMDDPMLDSVSAMRTFLRYSASDPSVSKAPVMIDSSHWETVTEALKNLQGRGVVNSISLRCGEEEFVRKALFIRDMGAAMVVMAFDEKGQAETFARKIEICRRSYELLTGAGIEPWNIIFDVNVLAVGTGIESHSRFAVDFIEAVRWIKSNLPYALTSGGISNLSFAFRGNNAVREAMHSAFLYHAVAAGLDMAIVNPTMLQVYDEINPELLLRVEDLIFDRRQDATSRLAEYAAAMAALGSASSLDSVGTLSPAASESASLTLEERLRLAVVKGGSEALETDLMEALGQYGSAIAVVEGPLLKGMESVGNLFSEGKMFLPQVVRSAKLMREAVSLLSPYMKAGQARGSRPRFVIATVEGDVHDIGKNITASVLECSGLDVEDLGVMVPVADILSKSEGASMIGVSGLISPSLKRMEELCMEMSSRGMTLPLFVGGAAASELHTALKLYPLYPNVHYGSDASATAVKAKRCLSDPEGFAAEEAARYEELKRLHESAQEHGSSASSSLGGAGGKPERDGLSSASGSHLLLRDIPLQELSWTVLEPFADWRVFDSVCRLSKSEGEEAVLKALHSEALEYAETLSVQLCARFFKAVRTAPDTIVAYVEPIESENGAGRLEIKVGCLSGGRSIADFFPKAACGPDSCAPQETQLGFFAAKVEGDDSDLLRHAVRAMMADAASSYMRSLFEGDCPEGVIMPGIGYTCLPDHSLKKPVLALLPIDITLTDGWSMLPEASVCGIVVRGTSSY